MGREGGDRARLYRNKTVNTVLVVPTKARKYRKALYIFDFILSGFGLGLISMSIVMLIYSTETFFPDWMVWSLFMVGLLVLVIGGLGGRGAVVSFRDLENGNRNWWLTILTLLVSFLLICELVVFIWGIIESEIIANGELLERSDWLATELERSIRTELRQQDEVWWDFQKQLECCGYDNNTIPDTLATGKYCTSDPDTTAPACKTRIWDEIAEQAILVISTTLIFLIMQFIVCVSAMCLACIIKAQEPIYSDY